MFSQKRQANFESSELKMQHKSAKMAYFRMYLHRNIKTPYSFVFLCIAIFSKENDTHFYAISCKKEPFSLRGD